MIFAAIITAAATLFGPVLAVVVQARISQPVPISDVNQANERIKALTERIERLERWGKRIDAFVIWTSLIVIIVGIPVLIGELWSSAPLSRGVVFRISLWTVMIVWNYERILSTKHLQIADKTTDRIDVKIEALHVELDRLKARVPPQNAQL